MGEQDVLDKLLHPTHGQFDSFGKAYKIDPAALRFSPKTIHVIRDELGNPLDDIRTERHNRLLADQITSFIREQAACADTAGDKAKSTTRLIVRDAFLDKCDFDSKKNDIFAELELEYTEGKWENTIHRVTSKAENPRQVERVPAGAKFKFEMVYNLFDDTDAANLRVVIEAMRLLEDDYLGGSGSRGYGQIEFQDMKFQFKTLSDYEGNNKRRCLDRVEKKHLACLSDEDVRKLICEVKKKVTVQRPR